MAASSPSIAFIGRVLFAFLFLSSGFQKLTSFNLSTGGPVMSGMAPKMDNFLRTVDQLAGVQLPLPQGSYIFLLAIAIFLELAGGLLFIFNSTLGAVLLSLFMIAVTPVMHNFWDEKENSPGRLNETINFFKNVAILGSLLFYIGGRPRGIKVHQA
ncbi:hypothetical protein ABBQ32_002747 [Trebouxia sp. C0010 RCD-2024]